MSQFLNSLAFLAQPGTLLLMLIGALIGVVFGAIPGLSGSLAITLMLPITYSMDSVTAMALLLSVYIGGTSGGCISAIMLGIPGTQASLATTYDGYAMTKKGKVVEALSAAVVANAIGTIPAVILAWIASRLIASVAVYAGPWEMFGLSFCAVVMVASLSKKNVIKGVAAAVLGFALSAIGTSPTDGYLRYTFGNYNLYSGLNMLYVLMGIFALRTILVEHAKRDNEKKQDMVAVEKFRWPGKALKGNVRNIVESWLIGLWTGFLPGIGPGLANIAAYARAQKTSPNRDEFGKGCIDGVLAPEVANNASLGGAMIPMISLGIPGDAGTAYLLGALTLHGLEPGPLLFDSQPLLVNVIFGSAIVAAIFVLLMETLGMRVFPSILNIPRHYLYPAIVGACFIGIIATQKTMFAVGMLVACTAFGVLFVWADLPTAPFILAFVLGEILETHLRRGLTYDATKFLTRPVSVILLLFAIYSLVSPYIKDAIRKKNDSAKG